MNGSPLAHFVAVLCECLSFFLSSTVLLAFGIAAADSSRIRKADLGRFTVDRLMSIINRLGSRVEVKIKVRRAEMTAQRLSSSKI